MIIVPTASTVTTLGSNPSNNKVFCSKLKGIEGSKRIRLKTADWSDDICPYIKVLGSYLFRCWNS